MTDEMVNLCSLVEKSADADLLREMIGFAAEKLMELEVGAKTGASFGENNVSRLAQRNGYRDQDWDTPGRDCGTAHPEAAHWQLLSKLPRAGPHGREGSDRCHSRSLHPGRFDPLGR